MEGHVVQQEKKAANKAPKSLVKIFALGGLGEIGKNMYGIEYKDEIIVIDAGVKFPRNDLPGIDYVIPSIQYLLENKERVTGIFLTHGHEDHIGGLPFILKQLNLPLYGAPLTIGLVRSKLDEHNLLNTAILNVIQEDTVITLKNMQVRFFRTNHSIPDSLGIAVKTPEGIVVHTGDFKFDLTPVDHPTNLSKIAQIGKEGVLALLSDSTNSEKPGYTPSERAVGIAIYDTIRASKGRILFATFASNVHRLQQVVEAAEATGRKLAILGRSMERVFRIGQELGYIRVPNGMLVSTQQLNKLHDSEVIIICTGSQGEPNAALSRIATGSNHAVQIHPNDTVIFSSSPIPGNTVSINKIIDLLFRAGAHVIHGSVIDIHASGHGCQEDLKLMLRLIKPRYFIPIHGEYRMQIMHAQLAEEVGVKKKNIYVMDLGQTVRLSKRMGSRGKKIPSGEVLVSGKEMGLLQNNAIEDRKQLSTQGVVFVLVTTNQERTKLLSRPEIMSRGFVFVKGSNELTHGAADKARRRLERLIKTKVNSLDRWETALIEELSTYFDKAIQRRPLIVPILTSIKASIEVSG